MNDKHKKLIEDAAEKEIKLRFAKYNLEGPEARNLELIAFRQGSEYILDNLQLFGLRNVTATEIHIGGLNELSSKGVLKWIPKEEVDKLVLALEKISDDHFLGIAPSDTKLRIAKKALTEFHKKFPKGD